MNILFNHIGYETKGNKAAVVNTKNPESEIRVKLFDAQDQCVFKTKVSCQDKVDKWDCGYFTRIDFSSLFVKGHFYFQLSCKDKTKSFPAFIIDDNLIPRQTLSDLLFYLKGQRCSGIYQKKDKALPFFGKRKGTVDVSGGWYDASGDYSKYFSHLSYAHFLNPQQTPLTVYALLKAYELLKQDTRPRMQHLLHRLKDEALWGADFLLRFLDEEGYFYTIVFDKWSKDIDQREICLYETQEGYKNENFQASYREGAGIAIAALAMAARLNAEGDFASGKYQEGAVKAFDYLQKNNTEICSDKKENIIDDYCSLMAASELFALTQEEKYRSSAHERASLLAERLESFEDKKKRWRSDSEKRIYYHASDAGLPSLSLLLYAALCHDQSAADKAVESLMKGDLALTDSVYNPFGYPRQSQRKLDVIEDRFFIPHENGSGYWWQGENARLASLATSAFYAASLGSVSSENKKKLTRFASDSLNWILGMNPFDICMLQGKGRNNPEYTEDWPNAPGGICNGITSDFEDSGGIAFKSEPYDQDPNQNWRWGEQWIPHGSWFIWAAAALASLNKKLPGGH